MTSDELKIDKRIVERNLKHGRLDAAEHQRALSALPDLSDKVWRRPQAAEAGAAPPSPAETEPPTATAGEVSSAQPQAPAPVPVPATFYSQG
jgi:hypothetical protein